MFCSRQFLCCLEHISIYYNLGFLRFPLLRTVHNYSYCHPITHPHIPRQIWGIYHTVCRHFLLSIHTSTYPVLSAVLSQLYTPHNHLQFCGRKHFIQRWKQNTHDGPLHTDISIIFTIGIPSLVTLLCSVSKYFLTDFHARSQNCEKFL